MNGNGLQETSNETTADLIPAVVSLALAQAATNAKLDALNSLLTAANVLDAEMLALQQAAADKIRSTWTVSWGAISGGGTTTLGQAGSTGLRVLTILCTAGTLLGALGLTTTTITLYHSDTTSRAYVAGNAASVLMGTFKLAANGNISLPLGADIPANRYLRATIDSGNSSVMAVIRPL